MKMPRARRLTLVLLSLATLLASGCAASAPTLTVRPTQRQAAYAQTFQQAWAARTTDGGYQFLLVSEDAVDSNPRRSRKAGETLRPVDRLPLRQVVHLKVLWRPLAGVDTAAGTNSTVEWFVFSDAASASGDLIEYQGTAFVQVTPKGDQAKVTIRDGNLTRRTARGQLNDPIGTARLSGKFTAVMDDGRLQDLLTAARERSGSDNVAMRPR